MYKMKTKFLTALEFISIFLGMSGVANAASLKGTDFSLSFNKPPFVFTDEPIGVCSFVKICSASVESIVPDTNPNIPTPPQPYINDTGFPIIGIFARLPKNRPQGPAFFSGGTSTIFGEIAISDDGQKLSFTSGVISINEVFFADFTTMPEADSTLFVTLASTPEPSSLLGISTLGLLLTVSLYLKKHREVQ